MKYYDFSSYFEMIQIKLYEFIGSDSGCQLQNKYLAGYANGGRTAFCLNCFADAKEKCRQG